MTTLAVTGQFKSSKVKKWKAVYVINGQMVGMALQHSERRLFHRWRRKQDGYTKAALGNVIKAANEHGQIALQFDSREVRM